MRLLILTALVGLCLGAAMPCAPARAQQPPHKKSFVQRHPTLTSAAAGIAAYKIAKKTGQKRALAGKKKNFAQRHPVLTGIGAAVATKHMINKSNKKQ